jgi:hypothetical protein
MRAGAHVETRLPPVDNAGRRKGRLLANRIRVSVDDLQVGQYVVLPGLWSRQPFQLSHFLLRSPGDLEFLRDAGYITVEVDLERSGEAPAEDATEGEPAASPLPEPPPPDEWNPGELVPPEFLELINDRHLPAPAKAQALHQATVRMMADLMRRPTLERVGEF